MLAFTTFPTYVVKTGSFRQTPLGGAFRWVMPRIGNHGAGGTLNPAQHPTWAPAKPSTHSLIFTHIKHLETYKFVLSFCIVFFFLLHVARVFIFGQTIHHFLIIVSAIEPLDNWLLTVTTLWFIASNLFLFFHHHLVHFICPILFFHFTTDCNNRP